MSSSGPKHSAAFEKLCHQAESRKLVCVLPLVRRGKDWRLRIEIKSGDKVIEFEEIKPSDSIDIAAKRLLYKMKQLLG